MSKDKKKPASTKKTVSKKAPVKKAETKKAPVKKAPTKKAHSKAASNKTVAQDLKLKKERIAAENKARNFQMIVLIIITFILLLLLTNRTFFRNSFYKKVDDREIIINIPRFSYFVKDTGEQLTVKTLRKSENTINYYDRYLQSETFTVYNCVDKAEPVYYNKAHKYFIYDLEVSKSFVVKTVKLKYSLATADEICELFE